VAVLLRDLSARRDPSVGLGRTEGSGCSASPRGLGRDDGGGELGVMSSEWRLPPARGSDGRSRLGFACYRPPAAAPPEQAALVGASVPPVSWCSDGMIALRRRYHEFEVCCFS
jgi:hypothetical protein